MWAYSVNNKQQYQKLAHTFDTKFATIGQAIEAGQSKKKNQV